MWVCLRTRHTTCRRVSTSASKRQQTRDAIFCMMGDTRTSFLDTLKTTKPFPMPKVTLPTKILDELTKYLIWRISICWELMRSWSWLSACLKFSWHSLRTSGNHGSWPCLDVCYHVCWLLWCSMYFIAHALSTCTMMNRHKLFTYAIC
jgi:hypothetical protein